MAEDITIKVAGFKELAEAFKELPAQIGKKVLKKALKKAAAPLLDELREHTPIYHTGSASNRTGGELQESMHIKTIRSHEETEAKVGVGTDMHYARFVEFGTRFQHANPFMERALDEAKDDIIQTFIEEASDELKPLLQQQSGGHHP